MEVNGQQWVPLCPRVRERPTDINQVRRVHKHPLRRHRHSLASAPAPPSTPFGHSGYVGRGELGLSSFDKLSNGLRIRCAHSPTALVHPDHAEPARRGANRPLCSAAHASCLAAACHTHERCRGAVRPKA